MKHSIESNGISQLADTYDDNKQIANDDNLNIYHILYEISELNK